MIFTNLTLLGGALLASGLQSTDAGWFASWLENSRWTIDESVRVVVDGDGDVATLAFFGLDIHKVISTKNGDIATLVLQPTLARVDSLVPTPPIYDGPDDWEVVWRIFNANIKLRQDGALNLRVGHLELPFGLETVLDTNGTLRQYQLAPDFGFKADWGLSLNGETDDVEYELAWTRGSGNHYRDDGEPGLISGRIGTSRYSDRIFGLSVADGEVLTPMGVVERQRVGVDAMFYRRNLGLFTELSTGSNGPDVDIHRALVEANCRNPEETVLGWVQLVGSDFDGSGAGADTLDSRLGVRWDPAKGWTMGVQYTKNLQGEGQADGAGSVAFQLRYRF